MAYNFYELNSNGFQSYKRKKLWPNEKKSTKKSNKNSLPGTIYLNGSRYWWKVQLPGENKPKARPLKPLGANFATTDYSTAIEIARLLLEKHLFEVNHKAEQEPVNIAQLVRTYMNFVYEYYVDSYGNPTQETTTIRCTLKPLFELFAGLPIEEFGPLRLKQVRERLQRRINILKLKRSRPIKSLSPAS